MKKILLCSILFICSTNSFGQQFWDINFEDPFTNSSVIIDTINDPNNIWERGQPSKTIFTTAYSSPNVIVTDRLNPYPSNDTSSFTIIHIAEDAWVSGYPKVDIGGWYYVNSDSLTDFGFIDFSSDLGNTWTRVDSSLGFCTWNATEDLPVFTGNSYGWKHFYYCLQVTDLVNYYDTILYRFTFVSDSVQTNKDGLMFDNLHFEDWAEGIEEFQNDNLISISPNPVSNELRIRYLKKKGNPKIQIFDFTGQCLRDDENFAKEIIDVRDLPNGIYLLKYSDAEFFEIKKFVVNH